MNRVLWCGRSQIILHMESDNPLARVNPSARVKIAAQLYATGVMPTKKAASEAAGLHPNYLGMLMNAGNPQVIGIVQQIESMMMQDNVDMSKIVQAAGKRALRNIAEIMENGGKEENRLRAAIDLADRYPETAKTQKIQSTSFSIDEESARALTAALVESSKGYKAKMEIASGDYVRVNTDSSKELNAIKEAEK